MASIELSANSMVGIVGSQSMRLVGRIHGKIVIFLVDSGATHNFIDPAVARRLGLQPDATGAFEVRIADGEMLKGEGYCRNVQIQLQGCKTSADLLVLPMGEAQIILGTVWLKSLGTILWDFNNLTMRFRHQGSWITITGIKKGEPDIIDAQELDKLLGHSYKAYMVKSLVPDTQANPPTLSPEVRSLLNSRPEVFSEPDTLPPSRPCDHRIPLLNPHQTVCLRPYRHPFHQKNEIEKTIKEMLNGGIIRPSTSPFASPLRCWSLREALEEGGRRRSQTHHVLPLPPTSSSPSSSSASFPSSTAAATPPPRTASLRTFSILPCTLTETSPTPSALP